MEATIRIDGRDVRFKATAAVPLLYRRKFNRDLIQDIQSVAKAMEGKEATGENLPLHALTMFECMAYIMAKHAEPAMEADSPEEWLEGFSTMSIYAVFPVIQALWTGNLERLEESKKKAELSIGRLQQPSSCSAPSSSESPSGTLIC